MNGNSDWERGSSLRPSRLPHRLCCSWKRDIRYSKWFLINLKRNFFLPAIATQNDHNIVWGQNVFSHFISALCRFAIFFFVCCCRLTNISSVVGGDVAEETWINCKTPSREKKMLCRDNCFSSQRQMPAIWSKIIKLNLTVQEWSELMCNWRFEESIISSDSRDASLFSSVAFGWGKRDKMLAIIRCNNVSAY